jgi:hypothetical protein
MVWPVSGDQAKCGGMKAHHATVELSTMVKLPAATPPINAATSTAG